MPEYEIVHSKSPVFFDRYERIWGSSKHQTHYCPGCGHGVVHKLVAEAISELGVQDDTVFVTPVGCSELAFCYFDLGHVQVAHGRAPAAATGLTRALPEKIVLSFQGDGDLAAIGIAEIIHAANRGEKMAVFFVNNAIYGMTGGQLAPTTLVGQTSTTSPWGRRPSNEGFPLHISEILAQLEMPVYIERVALSDNKNIMKARRAIRKAVELQKQHAGFALVEILSPCPTLWKKEPVKARQWVAEKMIPIYPLGIYRDRKPTLPEVPVPPLRSIAEVLELSEPKSQVGAAVQQADIKSRTRPCTLKVAGFGGQGVLLLGEFLGKMGMREGMEASWLPSYGPEMRGGSAHCHVCLSYTHIGSPLVYTPDVMIAMNEVSLRIFAPQVKAGGVILYNRKQLPEDFSVPQAKTACVPASEIADSLGSSKVANFVMLGAFLEQTACMPQETALRLLDETVKNRSLIELDRRAVVAGADYVKSQMETSI